MNAVSSQKQITQVWVMSASIYDGFLELANFRPVPAAAATGESNVSRESIDSTDKNR